MTSIDLQNLRNLRNLMNLMNLKNGLITELLIEVSLLLIWLGGWNLLCILLSDDSPEACSLLILVGVLLRAVIWNVTDEKPESGSANNKLIVFVKGSRKTKGRRVGKKRYMPLASHG